MDIRFNALALALLAAAGNGAWAQSAMGISMGIAVPTGAYRERTYPLAQSDGPRQIEGYDVGFGGQLAWNLPVSGRLALRLGFLAMETEGTYAAQGYGVTDMSHELLALTAGISGKMKSALVTEGTFSR